MKEIDEFFNLLYEEQRDQLDEEIFNTWQKSK